MLSIHHPNRLLFEAGYENVDGLMVGPGMRHWLCSEDVVRANL